MISEELLQSFIAEASDLLDDAEPSLVEYPRREDIEDRTEIVNRVFRHFHSIKGSAGFVGLHDIARLTHEAETLLEQYRKTPERIIPQEDINLLCRTVDLLRAIFANSGESTDDDGKDLGLEALIQEIIQATRKAKGAAPGGVFVAPPGVGLNAEETQVVDQESLEAAMASVMESDETETADMSEITRPNTSVRVDLGKVDVSPSDAEKETAREADKEKTVELPQEVVQSVQQTAPEPPPPPRKERPTPGPAVTVSSDEPAPRKEPARDKDTAALPAPGQKKNSNGKNGGKGSDTQASARSSRAAREQQAKDTAALRKGTAALKNISRTRRVTSDTARIIKGSQLARQDKFGAGDFAVKYVTEANELLEQIEQALLQAEQHPEASGDAIQEALRCLHSFKGNSGFMNLMDLERLSHRMESEVEAHIGRTLGLDSQTFDALLQMIDVLRQGVHDFSIGGSGQIPEADAYIEMMDEFTSKTSTRLRPATSVREQPDAAAKSAATPAPGAKQATAPALAPAQEPAREAKPDPEHETRRIGKPVQQNVVKNMPPSETTRMVLRGNSSQQVNLADLPKSNNIVISMDDHPEAPAPQPPSPVPQKSPDTETRARPRASDTSAILAKSAAPAEKAPSSKTKASDTGQKRRSADLASRNDIRVDLRKLDVMLDLVGELVIAEAMVTRHPVVWNADNESLERAVHQLRRVASSLQDMATSVRMIPLAPTFRRMTRLVYDLSVKAGKQVDLILLGEDTEVDRTVIERISDPMVHIIRNAIDHGIEKPEDRALLGKPETGRLTIEGHHEGGEVWIVITDDGRGLNRDAILSRAISRGLIQGDGSDLTDREIYHFIFEPGFSTAERVTDISGRGFGMDVVKKNIEKLSGRIDIQTRPGEGTAVVMRIPLTLAIIDGMLVASGDNRYIIPLLSIRESLRPEAEQIVTTPDGQEVLKLRGELIPIVKLEETFSRISNAKTLLDGILMIVEGEDGDVVALFADELIGQQETVIKGLSGWLKKSRGVSGCTILGDGEVGLILDIGAIVRMTRERSAGYAGL